MNHASTRRAVDRLLRMDDEVLESLVGHSVKTRELVMKASKMTPPRRPKGEKPATTIRYLQRQLRQTTEILAARTEVCETTHTALKGKMRELDSALDRLESANLTIEALNTSIDELRDAQTEANEAGALVLEYQERFETTKREFTAYRIAAEADRARLAFLEGYYAKSQETTPRIFPAQPFIAHYPAKTHDRPSPGNQENLSAGGQTCQSQRQDESAPRSGAGASDAVRSLAAHDLSHQERGAMEHPEINRIRKLID